MSRSRSPLMVYCHIGHFADHPVEDIIEKIACQFTARHIRGRPRPPYWYVGFPLYVCDSRYNDRERVFVRIKNWNSCVPEEVRQNTEFMPIYPFEKIVYPPRMPSPFLMKSPGKGAMKGPGGILSASEVPEGPGESDQRKRVTNPTSMLTPVRSTAAASFGYAALPAPTVYPQQNQIQAARRTPGPDKSIVTAAGASAQVEKLGPETGELTSVLCCLLLSPVIRAFTSDVLNFDVLLNLMTSSFSQAIRP